MEFSILEIRKKSILIGISSNFLQYKYMYNISENNYYKNAKFFLVILTKGTSVHF